MLRLEPSDIFASGCTRLSCEFGIEKEYACIRVRARLASRNTYGVEGIEGDSPQKGNKKCFVKGFAWSNDPSPSQDS